MSPVRAQAPFDLGWSFAYSPLVSGATDSLHLVIRNTALAPVRLRSVTIWFSWMRADTNLSPESPQGIRDLSAEQEVRYSVSIAISENVTMGNYYMTVILIYQRFQMPDWAGPESFGYVIPDVLVYSSSIPFSVRFDVYDGRIYSAIALITLVGWYLPKRLLLRAKG